MAASRGFSPLPPPHLRRPRWHGFLRCIRTSGGMDPVTFSAQSDGVIMFLDDICEDECTAGNAELEINHRNKVTNRLLYF
uniref:Uncharacterized protein n=1 Tax=Aegilops tauschii TaxID=37682 RepID=M8BKX2_AEGTA